MLGVSVRTVVDGLAQPFRVVFWISRRGIDRPRATIARRTRTVHSTPGVRTRATFLDAPAVVLRVLDCCANMLVWMHSAALLDLLESFKGRVASRPREPLAPGYCWLFILLASRTRANPLSPSPSAPRLPLSSSPNSPVAPPVRTRTCRTSPSARCRWGGRRCSCLRLGR